MSDTVRKFTEQVLNKHNTGVAKEHSYRPAIEELLESVNPDIEAVNEPKRTKVGAPDFVILKKDIQIAYLEAKDPHIDLENELQTKDQIKRYQSLGNLCFTNCLDWIFFRGEEKLCEVNIGYYTPDGIEFIPENFALLESYLQDFLKRQAVSIRSSKDLAKQMASKARLVKHTIYNSITSEDPDPVIHNQFTAFKEILIHDLDEQEFADIYAQTLAYGFFSARFYDPTLPTFSRDEARTLLPRSNPFLRKFFDSVAGIDANSEILWVIEDLVELFIRVDVAQIMHGFGKATEQTDAIIHFYETFLGEYDQKLRKGKGVYYTPQPVVDFIVRGVDEILKTEFGLSEGLKDTTKTRVPITIAEAQRQGIPDNELIQGKGTKYIERHKVQILDPATGTGTFPLAVMKHIYSQFANMEGMWPGYAKNELLPRLHGFELMMSSYSMAHLQLAMFLKETGVELTEKQRLEIYLTNSLEEAHSETHTLFSDFLSKESQEASKIKTQTPVMVVLGNPPYAVSSSNKGKWINHLIGDYKKDLNERKINLDDDYIKFIRYAEHYIEKNGEGIVAYISNNSFLDGVTHRQMRKKLLTTFDKIYIVDLHGNAKKKETTPEGAVDQNVFDIQQGVAIYFFVKTKKESGEEAQVFHLDLYGKRQTKYEFLESNSIDSISWHQLEPDPKYHFFVPKDFALQGEYEKGLILSSLFKLYNSGIQTKNDKVCVSFDDASIRAIVNDFNTMSSNSLKQKYDLIDTSGWTVDRAKNSIIDSSHTFCKILYRPFDIRYTCYTTNSGGFIGRPRHSTSRHFVDKKNYGLLTVKQQSTFDFQHIFISDLIVESGMISLQTKEWGYQIPLYTYEKEVVPNLDTEQVELIESQLKMKLYWEAGIDVSYLKERESRFCPVDLLDYIYAFLHSPNYRDKYKEFLKIDFPRVPFDVDQSEFWRLVELGSQLRKLHLMEDIEDSQLTVTYPQAGTNIVDKPTKTGDKVWINQTQYFEGVSNLAWNFYIGGYQPARKWLKDRKGRQLDYNDIQHYTKICHILEQTHHLMQKIDQ